MTNLSSHPFITTVYGPPKKQTGDCYWSVQVWNTFVCSFKETLHLGSSKSKPEQCLCLIKHSWIFLYELIPLLLLTQTSSTHSMQQQGVHVVWTVSIFCFVQATCEFQLKSLNIHLLFTLWQSKEWTAQPFPPFKRRVKLHKDKSIRRILNLTE